MRCRSFGCNRLLSLLAMLMFSNPKNIIIGVLALLCVALFMLYRHADNKQAACDVQMQNYKALSDMQIIKQKAANTKAEKDYKNAQAFIEHLKNKPEPKTCEEAIGQMVDSVADIKRIQQIL